MRFLSLAILATFFAAAPSAQVDVPQRTADPRADPSVPANQVGDRLRSDPTGITTGTIDPQTGNAAVINDPTLNSNGMTTGRIQGQGTASTSPQNTAPMEPDFSRMDRDIRAMGSDPNMARYSQERDAIRRDYDALGTMATPQDRMDVMNRYQGLDANVRNSRMGMSTRDDYFRMADDRIRMYDREIESARMGFSTATGNDRAERAQDLIRLRRQRDMYRNDVYDVRGAGRTGFDAARRQAMPNLQRYDTDFRNMRRESMMRGSTMSPGMNGGMRN